MRQAQSASSRSETAAAFEAAGSLHASSTAPVQGAAKLPNPHADFLPGQMQQSGSAKKPRARKRSKKK